MSEDKACCVVCGKAVTNKVPYISLAKKRIHLDGCSDDLRSCPSCHGQWTACVQTRGKDQVLHCLVCNTDSVIEHCRLCLKSAVRAEMKHKIGKLYECRMCWNRNQAPAAPHHCLKCQSKFKRFTIKMVGSTAWQYSYCGWCQEEFGGCIGEVVTYEQLIQ
jgi:hypothetical protein